MEKWRKKEKKKKRKNDAAQNTDEQCFGQPHGMAMACRGWGRIKDPHGIELLKDDNARNGRF